MTTRSLSAFRSPYRVTVINRASWDSRSAGSEGGEAGALGCDLLTRTHHLGDMAPDASLYTYEPAEPGQPPRRRLEELAFEILSTERRAWPDE